MYYSNFTLRLFDFTGDELRAQVVSSPVGRMRKADVVPYRHEIAPFLHKLEDPGTFGPLKERELHSMGDLLGEMLLPLRARSMFFKSLELLWGQDGDPHTRHGIRLLLELDDQWLTILPWEYARIWELSFIAGIGRLEKTPARKGRTPRGVQRDPEKAFLARNSRISIVRYESFVGAQEPAKLKRDSNVIFGFAEPDDVGTQIDLTTAFRTLVHTFRDHEAIREVQPKVIHRLTRKKLKKLGHCADLNKMVETLTDEDRVRLLEAKPHADKDLAKAQRRLDDLFLEKQSQAASEEAGEFQAGIFDYSGHGGLIPKTWVNRDGRLRFDPEVLKEPGEDDDELDTDRGMFGTRKIPGKRKIPAVRKLPGQRDLNSMDAFEPDHYPLAMVLGLEAQGAEQLFGMMLLEKEDGTHHIAWADEVAEILMDQGVQLVVLNTCQGGSQAGGSIFNWSGLAAALLEAGVPAVVAMQMEISNEAAIAFARGFYGALLSGVGSLDEAVAEGRQAIFEMKMADERDHLAWGTPVLYLRTPDGVIFDVGDVGSAAGAQAPEPAPAPAKQKPKRARRKSKG